MLSVPIELRPPPTQPLRMCLLNRRINDKQTGLIWTEHNRQIIQKIKQRTQIGN